MELTYDSDNPESIIFSCKCKKKTNILGQFPTRVFILTNKKIYSAKPEKLKAICNIDQLIAFTFKTNFYRDKHFIIHIKDS